MQPRTRLGADELVYHRKLIAMVRQAQSAWDLWRAHLAERYALGEGDAIDEQGRIRRG